jgi:hypothetical protein
MLALLAACGNGLTFNSTPIVTNLFPSNITAGSQDFTLFVVGTGFLTSGQGASIVNWNGAPLSTTRNVVTGELEAQVPAADVATANIAQVTVVNPPPGGGESVIAVSFTIVAQQAGAPTIASMSPFSPASANPGGPGFTLTINGTNFAVNDPVTWDGSVRTTTFVSSTQVTAAISSSDIATVGTASIAVATPGLVIASPSVNFSIGAANSVMPDLSSLSPESAAAGSPDLEFTINGSGFARTSFVEWNGKALPTSFISSSQLIALVPSAALAASGAANVDVNTPAPSGGVSKTLTFMVN